MDYVTALLAFIATLIGIVGNTWSKDASGWARVTRTGWAVVVLGGCALAVSTVQNYEKSSQARSLEDNKTKLAALAQSQIRQALIYTEDAMRLLNSFYRYSKKKPMGDLGDTSWSDPEFHAFLAGMDLTKHDEQHSWLSDDETWGHFVSRQLGRTHSRLTSTLGIYAPYLDSEAVAATEALRTCELFQLLPEFNQVYPNGKAVSLGGSPISVSFPSKSLPEFVVAYRALRAYLKESEKKAERSP
ncbi:hypothetical protein [Pseudorhodoferax sp.]|uniref:hypothetical protein n=1 Tax=Pseudorhodoferax sp. TaxID=1993553 RepID=UPI002DD69C9E|nr:hypothetical protein [Pseudorhodoferax sp.]